MQTDIERITESISNAEKELESDIASKQRVNLNKELANNRMLQNLYYKLKISDTEKKLLSDKFLVVKGKAGIGKTQLFANETFSILNNNDDVLLILGSTLCSSGNIIQQIEENLSIDMSFEELIEILEEMGRSCLLYTSDAADD